MNLKHLSDQALHSETKRIHQEHQTLLITLLHHLRENERRRLFSSYKYPSLFAYCIDELKLSEDEAGRRITAMRLLRDVPEIEKKVESGQLSLTNLVMAQSLFSHERKSGRKMSHDRKVEVLTKLENQSVRSARKLIAEINPHMAKKSTFELNAIEDDRLRERLSNLKGAFAHSHPNMNLIDLLHKLCDIAEEQLKPKPPKDGAKTEVNISRHVWQRDRAQCVNCGSTFALQEDHRIPRAVGGHYSIENIRLLCRSCNQRAAILYFGAEKMSRYLEHPRRRG